MATNLLETPVDGDSQDPKSGQVAYRQSLLPQKSTKKTGMHTSSSKHPKGAVERDGERFLKAQSQRDGIKPQDHRSFECRVSQLPTNLLSTEQPLLTSVSEDSRISVSSSNLQGRNSTASTRLAFPDRKLSNSLKGNLKNSNTETQNATRNDSIPIATTTAGVGKNHRQKYNQSRGVSEAHRRVNSTQTDHHLSEAQWETQNFRAKNPSVRIQTVTGDLRMHKSQRPAFSTLQQHFTPRKAPKALTSSFLAPPRNTNRPSQVLPNGTARLQQELIQLTLLHCESSTVYNQWEQSAEEWFRHRLEDLGVKYDEIHKISSRSQRHLNQLALIEWVDGCSSVGIAERMQLLSQCFHEIYTMTGPGSKYMRTMDMFESWLSVTLDARETRSHSGKDQSADFISEIDTSWYDEVQLLLRKLQSCFRHLQNLGAAKPGSALHQLLVCLRRIVLNALEELNLVKAIHEDISKNEILWINNQIKRMALDSLDDSDCPGSELHQGVWNR